MFPERIETDRLALERFCQERVDLFDLYRLFAAGSESADGVFEYVPHDPYRTVKEARDRLERAERRWSEGEAAWYAVYPAEGELAGYAALSVEWERRTGNVGFVLARPFWGRGYAGECATALTELAFDRLDLDLIAIGYEEGNGNSERAVEKYVERYGGRYDGVLRNWTPIGDDVLDHHRYTVTREQYQRATE
ncbi:GNAT family N-acetyltransferase [Halomarina halobia]|uniref:GNAT family N-acetyltransferase n=1 Tax=Halomarina halobia TaxID=3033386 RepID=A0ABD6ABY7_9EURY|nr:GNAT family N-acetyltransferase [Halomarina sp. PSR21]